MDQGSVVVLCRQATSVATLIASVTSLATCTIVGQFPQLQHWSQIQWRGLSSYFATLDQGSVLVA